MVVAAGTFCSPAILLRSGIGPAAELVELGIPIKADLPGVGANLQEHPSVGCAVPIEPMDGPRYQVLVTWASRLVPAGWPFDMHLVPAFNSLPVPRSCSPSASPPGSPTSEGRVQ